MSPGADGHVTRRRLLATGGSAAALGLAASAAAAGSFGLGGTRDLAGFSGRFVALGCSPVPAADDAAPGRLHDLAGIAGSLPRVTGRWASLSVLAFHAAQQRVDGPASLRTRDFGDFADAKLRVHVTCGSGEELPVVLWGCTSDPVACAAAGARMQVPISRSTAIPLSLDVERDLSPLARRLRAAAGAEGRGTAETASTAGSAAERVQLTERLELPLRRGIYVVAGRRVGSGRLPSWDACRVTTSPQDGVLALRTHGLGVPRPVDFPYLVIRVDHVETPPAIPLA